MRKNKAFLHTLLIKALMTRFGYFFLLCVLVLGCKKDDAPTCTKCNSDLTGEFELCRESNGNASVNGQDTGTNYESYLSALEDSGTSCGGG